jgi:exodeoxyribonuclease VII large subunit
VSRDPLRDISRFNPYPHATTVFSVSELALQIAAVIDADPGMQDVWVRGEVTNLSRSGAGHHYFTLKDPDAAAQLRCVLFRGSQFNSPVTPANGLALVAHGTLRFYERFGTCELVADLLFPEGVGLAQMQWESVYRRLEGEGLFSATRKRPLPRLPQRVGIVTSERGAVIHDFLNVIGRRFPLVEVVFAPSPVQGPGSAAALTRAVGRLARWQRDGHGVDVVVVARGGGSDEDLAAFNDERLARAIFAAPVPVVSAVGHETNSTLADLVADVRAPTASAAAELIAPDVQALLSDIHRLRRMSRAAVDRRIAHSRAATVTLQTALRRRLAQQLATYRERLASSSAQLRSLSPEATLSRGYAIARIDGRIVRDAASVEPGAEVQVQLHRGQLNSRVESVEPSAEKA